VPLLKRESWHACESSHGAESVAPDGISLQAPSCFGSALTNLATGKKGLQRGLRNRKWTVILFLDETILRETPPLRAVWGRIDEQTCVPITGNRNKRVLYGVLNVKTGRMLLHSAGVWNQEEFQKVLRQIRRTWRGWRIVLFLDRGSPHKAKGSMCLASELGIEMRWLPVACPELNPVDHLWRRVKQDVLANEPPPDLDASVGYACQYIFGLTPQQAQGWCAF